MTETQQDVSRRKMQDVELALLKEAYDLIEASMVALLKDGGVPYTKVVLGQQPDTGGLNNG